MPSLPAARSCSRRPQVRPAPRSAWHPSPVQAIHRGRFRRHRSEAVSLLLSRTADLDDRSVRRLGLVGRFAAHSRRRANGTTFVVRARCTNAEGVMAQAYGPATFTVTGAARGLGGARPGPPTAARAQPLHQIEAIAQAVHIHVHLRGQDRQKSTGDRDHHARRLSSPGDRARPRPPPQTDARLRASASRPLQADAAYARRARPYSHDRAHDDPDQLTGPPLTFAPARVARAWRHRPVQSPGALDEPVSSRTGQRHGRTRAFAGGRLRAVRVAWSAGSRDRHDHPALRRCAADDVPALRFQAGAGARVAAAEGDLDAARRARLIRARLLAAASLADETASA